MRSTPPPLLLLHLIIIFFFSILPLCVCVSSCLAPCTILTFPLGSKQQSIIRADIYGIITILVSQIYVCIVRISSSCCYSLRNSELSKQICKYNYLSYEQVAISSTQYWRNQTCTCLRKNFRTTHFVIGSITFVFPAKVVITLSTICLDIIDSTEL